MQRVWRGKSASLREQYTMALQNDSVTITSFYAFLLITINNGLATHYYKSKTKADLRMKVNDGPSLSICPTLSAKS